MRNLIAWIWTSSIVMFYAGFNARLDDWRIIHLATCKKLEVRSKKVSPM
jgi:hypothetical protein